jgi:hypothetical protein
MKKEELERSVLWQNLICIVVGGKRYSKAEIAKYICK